jgi:hypothetical protein
MRPRKGERGAIFVLVLVSLAVGALIIPPTVHYVSTGLKSARISQDRLLQQYATDGAVEYSRWQLAYNVGGVVTNLSLANPSSATTVTLNGIVVPTTIEISLSGEGGEPGPMPATESGIHLEAVLQVDPGWAPTGQPVDFDYIVHARNYGESAISLKGVLQILPPNFEYVEGSYGGPPNPVFTKTWVTDHWELRWDFGTPRPKVNAGQSYPIPFTATGFLPTGNYNNFGTGYVFFSAFGQEEVLQTGNLIIPYAIGLYDITATAGSYKIKANAGIFETGVQLNSYQSP